MKREFIILGVIFLVALFVRYFNFDKRITFGSEQARSLIVSARFIKEKPSFLGQEYFRTTATGHKLFSGALFSYTLVPLQTLFSFNPLLITAYFPLLNVLTGLILFILFKRLFDWKIATFALILFVFNNYMIYHSMFIWILNYYPLIGLLALYYLFAYHREGSLKNIFILGLISGIGINFHYLFIPFAALLFFYALLKSRERTKAFLIFVIGSLIGNFPMVLFDLRHDFYHLRTLGEYGMDVVTGQGEKNLVYYHFLQLWPALALVGALIINRIWKSNKAMAVLVIFFYVFLNLNSSLVSFNKPIGMPEELFYEDIISASKAIADDNPGNFNVAALLDFDTRGHVLRYPLEFLFDKKPLGPEEYQMTEVIYVLSKTDYDFENISAWELTVTKPYDVFLLKDLGNGYAVLKLVRQIS